MLDVFGKLYGGLTVIRNAAYDRAILATHPLGRPTISVGNLTVGGTGKTPLVKFTARLLAERGDTVCVLTRGYGRASSGRVLVSNGSEIVADARASGDEAMEIARAFDGKIVVIADADRVAAAKWAAEQFAFTSFILDDGFQHRRADRDVDIVCIDATAPGGPETTSLSDGRMLPFGRLREPVSGLRRATCVVLTRCEQANDLAPLIAEIETIAPGMQVFRSEMVIVAYLDTDANVVSQDQIGGAFAFCGLGNPTVFYRSLELSGLSVVGHLSYPDHHSYGIYDAAQIVAAARQAGAQTLVTTAKDAVKLAEIEFEMPIVTAVAEMTLDDTARFAARF